MKDLLKLSLTLTSVCATCALLLAFVHQKTKAPIEIAKRAKTLVAAQVVLPANSQVIETNGVFVAQREGQIVGYATKGTCPNGYGGPLELMVGVDAEGKLVGYSVVDSKETPGLGSQIADKGFKNQFVGKPTANNAVDQWKVRQDGGDFDAVTAATISSRAAIGAIQDAIRTIAKITGK